MIFTRRAVLQASAAAALASSCKRYSLGVSSTATYDEVLDAIHKTDLIFGAGVSNHAPMASEALVAGGRADRVATWAEGYSWQLEPLMTEAPLSAEAQASALGHNEQRAAWIATYQQDLETLAPTALIAREWARLQPAFMGFEWHGVIRTAHAFRALGRDDTPSRRHELAHGLALMAAHYQTLPGDPGAQPQSGLSVAQALAAVPLLPASQRVSGGLINKQLAPLATLAGFPEAVAAVDLDAQPVSEAFNALIGAAARLFVNDGTRSFALLHAITGSSAARLLLPALDAAGQRQLLGRAFQSVAGSYAILAKGTESLQAVTASRTAQSLLDQGLASDDDHDIKLSECCFREDALGTPDVLAAAEAWLS